VVKDASLIKMALAEMDAGNTTLSLVKQNRKPQTETKAEKDQRSK